MQFLVYILLYPIFWIVSLLPFPILYALSDCIYVIVYRILGYRKKIVRHNLSIALPHLSTKERHSIERKFYHHLIDLFLEMIKTMTISENEMKKRFTFTNLDTYQQLEDKGKSIVLMCGHYASYEWLLTLNLLVQYKGVAIYKQVANKYFDQLVRDIRSKFKTDLVDTKHAILTMEHNQKTGKKCVYGFATDQSPKLSKAVYWQKFMGIEVPVHINAELLAKRLDMNVLFVAIQKVKRGYYQATFTILASDNVEQIPNYQITDAYLKLVENQIYQAPEYYLWTHKRWKHCK